MKAILASALLVALTGAATAAAEAPAAAETYTLTLTIEGVRSADGNILAQILKADPSLGKAVKGEGKKVQAVAGTMTMTFSGLPAGEYAVNLFHDEDGDGEMKLNAFGMPKEGFAFSNRAKAKFGPPKFSDMKVTVSADAATAAVLAY